MKLKKINRNIFLVGLMTLSCVISCKKFVQIPPSISDLQDNSIFTNNYTATAALLSIYAQMRVTNSYDISIETGLLSDELTYIANDPLYKNFYRNEMVSNASYSRQWGLWTDAYSYIYQANSIIAGLNTYNGINTQVKQQLLGEAKFIRAFWYFYLTNLYGDVPLALTTDFNVTSKLSRSSIDTIYLQAISDLEDAKNLLSNNYVDVTDTTVTIDRIRPNSAAASALLARIYLYTKDYNKSEAESSTLIADSRYLLEDSLNNVFLTTSREAIWQLGMPLPYNGGYNVLEAGKYIFTTAFNISGTVVSPQLLASFDSGDMRRSHWISSYTTTSVPAVTRVFPYKYKVYNSPDITEYTMMLRLAEQYLIRAEAEANGAGAGLSGAVNDLNIIRHRAGLADFTGNTQDKSAVITAILHERQVELFTEWGHRWMDLNRTGAADRVMGPPGNVTELKGGTWDNHDKLWPIPFRELQTDQNLTQNLGY